MMKFKLLPMMALFFITDLALADVEITGIRVNAPIPGQTLSAGYFNILNSGSQAVSIVKVSSDEAERVEMHNHIIEGDMAKMVKVDSVSIDAGQQLSFTEGGYHLMIFQPNAKSVGGGEMDIIFELSDGTQLEEAAFIEPLAN